MHSLKLYFLFRGRTHDRPVVEQLLDRIEEEPLLVPTHASMNERKRKPYDRASLLDDSFGPNGYPPYFWRTKAPKYAHAGVGREYTGYNLVSFEFDGTADKHRAELFEAASRLAARIGTEFAFVHLPAPQDWPHWREYNNASGFPAVELWRKGIPNLFARTWFGPSLLEHVGRNVLASIPGGTPTSWGGIQIDLAPEPWTADFDTLFASQQRAREPLGKAGFLIETSGVVWKRAPNWTAPPWDMGNRKWDR
jgi:hypothetical protein